MNDAAPHTTLPGLDSEMTFWTGGVVVITSVMVGLVVLMLGGLPVEWGVTLLAGLLLLLVVAIIPVRRRFLEAALMLSFGANIDYHIGHDPTHLVSPSGVPVSVTGLVVGALWLWWACERWGRRQRSMALGGLGVPLVGLWASAIISTLGAPQPRFGLYALVNLAYFTLLFLYLAQTVSTPEHLRFLLKWLMIGIMVTSVVGLAEYHLQRNGALAILGMLGDENKQTLASSDLVRIGGLLGSSNGLAWVLAEILPLMLALFFCRASGYNRVFLFGGVTVCVLALISTYSRGGWVAFGVAFILLILLMGSRRFGIAERGWRAKVVLLGVFLAVAATPLYGNVYTRLTEDDRGSAYARVLMMKVALRMIEDHPLFGVGLNNYERVMDEYDGPPERIHQAFPWPVHNIYLHTTAEVGLLGGGFFVLFALLALWQGLRAARADDLFLRAVALGLSMGLVAYLLVGMKELGSLGNGRFFWLAVGLLVATRRLSEAGQHDQSQPVRKNASARYLLPLSR